MSDSLNPTSDAEQLMLGAIPGKPALGRGPVVDGGYSRHPYHHPAAGWGAAESVANVLARAGEPIEGFRAIFVMNHADGGFDCPGCAWADDPSGLKLDICENGIKHVTWELQPAKANRDFFATHTVSELATWSDYDLEAVGRLAEPLLYNPRDRQVRACLLGRRFHAGWRNASCSEESASGVILYFRTVE